LGQAFREGSLGQAHQCRLHGTTAYGYSENATFRHAPKNRCTLRNKNPLNAVKSSPSLFVRIREAGDAR